MSTVTEKGGLAHASTRSRCLDFFVSGLLRDGEQAKTVRMFQSALQESPVVSLQILMHARDIRRGKGERKCVFSALKWLQKNKPKTYEANLKAFIDVGCYRDLLFLAQEDSDIELEVLTNQLKSDAEHLQRVGDLKEEGVKRRDKGRKRKAIESVDQVDAKSDINRPTNCDNKEEAATERTSKRRKVVVLSLAAKWAPSERGTWDKAENGNLYKRVSKLMFPGKNDHRKRTRKLLSKLRKHLNIVESSMCANKWKSIDFEKVPSRAINKYRNAFASRDGKRYSEYLVDVAKGKKTIKSRTMQPHELAKFYLYKLEEDKTVEAQWKALVDDLKKNGGFKDTVAVSDVSGSMDGVPMQVSIALGILVAQLSHSPYKGRLITFEENPQWHKVPTESSLKDMVENVARMNWGGSTRLDKVFDLILDVAIANELPQSSLPKTLLIFTDMQFDKANGEFDEANRWGPPFDRWRPNTKRNYKPYKTLYEECKNKFEIAGYTLPKVVFWNLRAAKNAFPVDKDAPGTVLLSGFSSQLLKNVMNGCSIITPQEMMLETVSKYNVQISKEEFKD